MQKVERMFLGQFYHNLDDKGRLTVPARFRDLLVPEGAYIMQGFDHNLVVLPSRSFESLSHRINSMSMTDPMARLLRRLLFSSADRVDVDRAGRILIPQFLRDANGLQNSVVVVGNGDYFEIWSPEEWALQTEQLQDAQSNAHRFAELDLPPID
jgi:MraZ protein